MRAAFRVVRPALRRVGSLKPRFYLPVKLYAYIFKNVGERVVYIVFRFCRLLFYVCNVFIAAVTAYEFYFSAYLAFVKVEIRRSAVCALYASRIDETSVNCGCSVC